MSGQGWSRWLKVASLVTLAVAAAAVGGCRRGAPVDGTPLYAPFNQRKPVAALSARIEQGSWQIAVRSLMQGRLALHLDEIRLIAESGSIVTVERPLVECVLPGGKRLHLTEPAGDAVPGNVRAEARASAIPLDDPGRTMYREWAWIRRPTEITQIDAELSRLDALPECR